MFGRYRSVCSWAGAHGFKANPAPLVAEADGAAAFVLNVGQLLLPARDCCGKLVRVPWWCSEVKSWWVRGSKKSKWRVLGLMPSSWVNLQHPLSSPTGVGASSPHPRGAWMARQGPWGDFLGCCCCCQRGRARHKGLPEPRCRNIWEALGPLCCFFPAGRCGRCLCPCPHVPCARAEPTPSCAHLLPVPPPALPAQVLFGTGKTDTAAAAAAKAASSSKSSCTKALLFPG